MTEKELLYVEDALGHAQYFQTKCTETVNQIQDSVEEMGREHQKLYQNFYNLL